MFRIAKQEDGTWKASFVEEDEYIKGLNQVHWLEAALVYAEEADVFNCPHCKTEIGNLDYEGSGVEPIEVPMGNAKDMLSSFFE